MVGIGSMAQDPFVLFVEGVHGPPSESDPFLQLACIGGQVDVSPRRSRGALSVRSHGVPRRTSEVGVLGGVLAAFQGFCTDIGLWEVRHRISAWLEEQKDALTVRDPNSTEAHAHPPPQR